MKDESVLNGGIGSNIFSPATETSTGSPGTILRRCREFHEISLEEASEATKIGLSHLKALEEDRIKDFANQAYLKGFLRIYTTYLGLNSDDIARMYEKLFGAKTTVEHSKVTANTASPRKSLITLKKILLPGLLLVAIFITASFFKKPTVLLQRQLPSAVMPSITPSQNMAVQTIQSSARVRKAEAEIPAKKVEKLPAVESVETEADTSKTYTQVPVRSFILKIKVTQNGTLAINVDGVGAQQYELTTGDVIEWKAEKKVTLDLSNAGGVEIELNGKPYKSLGSLGKPAYIEFDGDGIKP